MSERSEHDVLLVEAGPDYPDSLPDDLRDGTRNSMSRHDWHYRHRATPSAGTFVYPRGRVVGGSTAVNTCIALRGQPYDYDEWELEDWTWERCFDAFKRLETDLDFPQADYHGDTGPIRIRRHTPDELTPWQAAFLEACATLGFERQDDANEPCTEGFGPHAMNKIDGVRQSVARGYLDARVRARDNLRIRGETLVRRVLFEGRRVVGVEVETDGRIERIGADRVVLSAGAVHTPGILLRSGIGPREEVRRLGVELVADNAWVGKRLLDHPGCAIFLSAEPGVSQSTHMIQTVLRYTSRGGQRADMILQPGSFAPLPWGDTPLVTLMAAIGKPRGWGTIRFEADPRSKPVIDSRFLLDPDDLEMAMEAMEIAWLLATSAPMRGLARPVVPRERGLTSRRAMKRWILKQTGSGYHPCGTVPMGESANESATDSRGRVWGVEGLLVADASLFPTVPSANTNLTTIMLGERFGEWLREGELS